MIVAETNPRRRRLRRLLIAILAVFVVLAILAGGWLWLDSGDSKAKVISRTPTATATAKPGVDINCDKGLTGEFALDESLHGSNGKILNSGATDNASILEAAKHDPFVLHAVL